MPHRKGHKKEDLTDPLRPGAGRPARGQDIETTPKVFKINDRVVSEEEFGAESIKLRSQAEGERIRQAGGIGPEEIAARKERRVVIERQPGREIEAGVALEEAGAFEEVTPKEVSLVPARTPIIPVNTTPLMPLYKATISRAVIHTIAAITIL